MRIRLAHTDDERQGVFAFRYGVYVVEMGREQRYADHARCMIEEPLDRHARIFYAEDACGRVVGTVRSNHSAHGPLGDYATWYGLDALLATHPQAVSITTKLMVDRAHRAGTLAFQLATATYGDGLRSGVRFDFIDCNPHLEPFFAKLGYRRWNEPLMHPEYGMVQPFVLHLTDLAYLESIKSPFARYCQRHRDVNMRSPSRETTGARTGHPPSISHVHTTDHADYF